MAPSKIGIFPASGGLGGSTAKHILRRLPASNLVFIARRPEKLAAAVDAGVTVRQGDYNDDASLQRAFEGVETLFLISYASVEIFHRIQAHKKAINTAIQQGVKHIFYSSLGFAGESKQTVAHVMKPHLQTELYLEECARRHPDFTYTAIREGLYSESVGLYTAFFDMRNPVYEIKIAHDGVDAGIAWIKRDELGEATAEIIKRYSVNKEAFPFVNQTVLFTGPKALSLAQTVEILGRIVGRPVFIGEVSEDEFVVQPKMAANFTYRGVDYSRAWATSFEAFRRGETAVTSALVSELIGRTPEDFETTMRGMLRA